MIRTSSLAAPHSKERCAESGGGGWHSRPRTYSDRWHPMKAPALKPEPLKYDADGWAALGKQVAFLARAREGK